MGGDCGCKGGSHSDPNTFLYLKSKPHDVNEARKILNFNASQMDTALSFVEDRGECLVFSGPYSEAFVVGQGLAKLNAVIEFRERNYIK